MPPPTLEDSSGDHNQPEEPPTPQKKRATGTRRSAKTTNATTTIASDDSSGDEYRTRNPRIQNKQSIRPRRSAATNKSRITLEDYHFSEDSEDEIMEVDERLKVDSSTSVSNGKARERSTSEESSSDDYQPNASSNNGFKQRWICSRKSRSQKRDAARTQQSTGIRSNVVTPSDSEDLSDGHDGSDGDDMELDEEDEDMEVDDNDPSGPAAIAENDGLPIDQWKLPVQKVDDWSGSPENKKQKKGTPLPEHMFPRITKDHKMPAEEIQKLLVDTYKTFGMPNMAQRQEICEKTGMKPKITYNWFRKRNQTLEEKMESLKKERERFREWRDARAAKADDDSTSNKEQKTPLPEDMIPKITQDHKMLAAEIQKLLQDTFKKVGVPNRAQIQDICEKTGMKMETTYSWFRRRNQTLEERMESLKKRRELVAAREEYATGSEINGSTTNRGPASPLPEHLIPMKRKRKTASNLGASKEARIERNQSSAISDSIDRVIAQSSRKSAITVRDTVLLKLEAKKLKPSAQGMTSELDGLHFMDQFVDAHLNVAPDANLDSANQLMMETAISQPTRQPVVDPDQPLGNSLAHEEAGRFTNYNFGNQEVLKNPNPFHKFEDFSSLDLKYLHGRFMEYKNPEFDQLVMWGMVTQRDTYQIYQWVKLARLACGEQQHMVTNVNHSEGLEARDSLFLTKKYKENSYPRVTQIESWATEIQKSEQLVFTWVKKNYEVLQVEIRKKREQEREMFLYEANGA